MNMQRAGRRGMLLVAAILVSATTACSDSTASRTPGAINMTAGNNTAVSTSASTSLAVTVLDNDGSPVAGATVTWSILAGEGRLSAEQTVTNDEGIATVQYTAGGTAQTATISAKSGKLDTIFKVFIVE